MSPEWLWPVVVVVHPAHRGWGIARTVISVAIEHARAAGAETVILGCRPDQVPLCKRLGWSRLSVPVTVQQPDGERTLQLTTMIYDLADLPQPIISVDLRACPSDVLGGIRRGRKTRSLRSLPRRLPLSPPSVPRDGRRRRSVRAGW